MATNVVEIVGDSSHMRLETTDISGPDPLEFLSGSFRSTPEERRVVNVFLTANGAILSLRFEFTSQLFPEHSITGARIYNTEDAL